MLAELNWLEWAGIAFLGCSAASIALVLWWAVWLGGETDVSGAPERDAGYSEEEIASMSEVWDRGSCRTAEAEEWKPSESARFTGGHDV